MCFLSYEIISRCLLSFQMPNILRGFCAKIQVCLCEKYNLIRLLTAGIIGGRHLHIVPSYSMHYTETLKFQSFWVYKDFWLFKLKSSCMSYVLCMPYDKLLSLITCDEMPKTSETKGLGEIVAFLNFHWGHLMDY